MKDKKYLYPGLVAIFCALMVSLGLVSLIYGSPGTTVIGKDISTRNLTVSGTSTITNLIATTASSTNLTVSGNATSSNLSVTGILRSGSAPFYIDSSGNASTTGTFIAATTTVTTLNTGQGDYELYAMNQNVRTDDSVTFANLTVSTNATSATLAITGAGTLGSATIGTNFKIDSSGNASTTGDLIVGGTTTLGGGSAITKLLFGSITLNFAEVATNTSALATTSLPNGASADMKCFLQPPDLPDDFLPKGCTTTASYIGATLYNDGQEAAGTDPDGSGANWGYLLIK